MLMNQQPQPQQQQRYHSKWLSYCLLVIMALVYGLDGQQQAPNQATFFFTQPNSVVQQNNNRKQETPEKMAVLMNGQISPARAIFKSSTNDEALQSSSSMRQPIHHQWTTRNLSTTTIPQMSQISPPSPLITPTTAPANPPQPQQPQTDSDPQKVNIPPRSLFADISSTLFGKGKSDDGYEKEALLSKFDSKFKGKSAIKGALSKIEAKKHGKQDYEDDYKKEGGKKEGYYEEEEEPYEESYEKKGKKKKPSSKADGGYGKGIKQEGNKGKGKGGADYYESEENDEYDRSKKLSLKKGGKGQDRDGEDDYDAYQKQSKKEGKKGSYGEEEEDLYERGSKKGSKAGGKSVYEENKEKDAYQKQSKKEGKKGSYGEEEEDLYEKGSKKGSKADGKSVYGENYDEDTYQKQSKKGGKQGSYEEDGEEPYERGSKKGSKTGQDDGYEKAGSTKAGKGGATSYEKNDQSSKEGKEEAYHSKNDGQGAKSSSSYTNQEEDNDTEMKANKNMKFKASQRPSGAYATFAEEYPPPPSNYNRTYRPIQHQTPIYSSQPMPSNLQPYPQSYLMDFYPQAKYVPSQYRQTPEHTRSPQQEPAQPQNQKKPDQSIQTRDSSVLASAPLPQQLKMNPLKKTVDSELERAKFKVTGSRIVHTSPVVEIDTFNGNDYGLPDYAQSETLPSIPLQKPVLPAATLNGGYAPISAPSYISQPSATRPAVYASPIPSTLPIYQSPTSSASIQSSLPSTLATLSNYLAPGLPAYSAQPPAYYSGLVQPKPLSYGQVASQLLNSYKSLPISASSNYNAYPTSPMPVAVANLFCSDPKYPCSCTLYLTEIHTQNMLVSGICSGLRPNAYFSLQIHEYGDITSGCNALGAFFDPLNGSQSYKRSPGQMGNLGQIKSDVNGVAFVNKLKRDNLSLGCDKSGQTFSVLGRALGLSMVNDYGSKLDYRRNLPAYESASVSGSNTIACGVVGIATKINSYETRELNSKLMAIAEKQESKPTLNRRNNF